ncbi:ArsR family transcriptional regulator [Roseomonas sp. HJA6]|uniref:ArsR family transcriptional regulator n=1 Tax=Roseomonas alba TaxID=2846776 RepID=A0ABS7AIB8_9PROT|nr:ArsR family transcriptional regulator [Neoroseomonas alba]MBW6402046.1 ArsR family transcriptional regulator [Neoroseomonas alba]
MPPYPQMLAEDRRLTILRTLQQDDDLRVNEFVLKRALEQMGHDVNRELVRADLAWLRAQLLITVREEGGEVWIATATEDGVKVATGRRHPGVAYPVAP